MPGKTRQSAPDTSTTAGPTSSSNPGLGVSNADQVAAMDASCNRTVVPGDTLWDIAHETTGHGTDWSWIYDQNRSVVGDNPDLILPGQQLNVCRAPEVPPPAHGLDAYEVVADDFVGPLAPNQIRQSQHDELSNFDFGGFDVVGDDFVGPLQNGQMTQSQYDALQQGWLRMSEGGGGLGLQGSDADQETFKHMLRDGMTDSPYFRQMYSDFANDPDTDLTMDLGRSQAGLKVDAFEWESSGAGGGTRNTQTIDLDDYENIPGSAPADHPDAQIRTQKLIHAMTEAHTGAESAEADPHQRYLDSHYAAITAENLYRAEQGQGGNRGNDDPHGIGGHPGDWRYDLDNGFVEDWDWTGTDLDSINYTEPAH